MYTGVHRFLTLELLVNPPSSGTLAFSLRLAPFLPDSDSSRGAAAYDSAGDSSLIGHPQVTSFLSVFSVFPMGPGCWQLG
jgi:hypothetical protein